METSHGRGPQALKAEQPVANNRTKCRSLLWMVSFLISALVVIVLLPCPTCADSEATLADITSTHILRVGVNPEFRPFSYVDGSGRRVGVDLDIAHLLAAQLNVDLKIVVPERFDDLIPMLQRGEIDIIIAGMSRIFKRARLVDFTEAYFTTGVTILMNRETCYTLGIADTASYSEMMNTLKFLNKEDQLKIIVTENKAPAESAQVFFPKAQIIPYPTNEASLKALDEGKGHIMVHDEMYLKNWAAHHAAKAFKLRVFSKPYKQDTYGFAVAKGNMELLKMLNIFIEDKLFNEGYFARFMAKHHLGGGTAAGAGS
jgi:polar amino acid transport system substrate-binding protein